MSFILSCIFYAFIGSITGLIAHTLNSLVQEHVTVNAHFLKTLVWSYAKVVFVLATAVILSALFIVFVPESFLENIGTNKVFLHELVYFLYSFAAFDFTLKHVVEPTNGHSNH